MGIRSIHQPASYPNLAFFRRTRSSLRTTPRSPPSPINPQDNHPQNPTHPSTIPHLGPKQLPSTTRLLATDPRSLANSLANYLAFPSTSSPTTMPHSLYGEPTCWRALYRCFMELNFDFWNINPPGIPASERRVWRGLSMDYEDYCRQMRKRGGVRI